VFKLLQFVSGSRWRRPDYRGYCLAGSILRPSLDTQVIFRSYAGATKPQPKQVRRRTLLATQALRRGLHISHQGVCSASSRLVGKLSRLRLGAGPVMPAPYCHTRQSARGPADCGTRASGEQASTIAQTCVAQLLARPVEHRGRVTNPTPGPKRLARRAKSRLRRVLLQGQSVGRGSAGRRQANIRSRTDPKWAIRSLLGAVLRPKRPKNCRERSARWLLHFTLSLAISRAPMAGPSTPLRSGHATTMPRLVGVRRATAIENRVPSRLVVTPVPRRCQHLEVMAHARLAHGKDFLPAHVPAEGVTLRSTRRISGAAHRRGLEKAASVRWALRRCRCYLHDGFHVTQCRREWRRAGKSYYQNKLI